MNIIDAQYVHLDKNWQCENVCLPFTRIYMPTSGTEILKIGDEIITLIPGNIYLLPSMLSFSYSCNNCLEKSFFHIIAKNNNLFDLFPL